MGLIIDDKAMLAVLLDDANTLQRLLEDDTRIRKNGYTLRCAYADVSSHPASSL